MVKSKTTRGFLISGVGFILQQQTKKQDLNLGGEGNNHSSQPSNLRHFTKLKGKKYKVHNNCY